MGMIIICGMTPERPNRPATVPAALARDRAAVTSQELFRGGKEILIRHGDQVYRLCHTRNDKLILIK
jgi:hemin uptake protein HemP